jgi:tetratricopeptide (TPR) repeat protein
MRFRLPFLPVLALLVASGCAVPAAGLGGAQTALDAQNYPAALALADTALARNPNDVAALTLRSEIRARQILADSVGSVDSVSVQRMMADAQQALALGAGDPAVLRNQALVWSASMNRGGRAYNATPRDMASARILFRAASMVQPDSVAGHLNYGAVLLASGDDAGAVAPLREAVRLEPDNAVTVRRLGMALMGSGQAAEAVTVLTVAADRFPNDAGINADLFAAYEQTGQTDQALARYQTRLATATPQTEPDLRLAYGIALLQARRVDDAIREFERSVELAPGNAVAQYNLGAAIQNKAAALNTQANAATDNAENRRLVAERNVLLERSLPYFERARTLSAAGADQQGACTALFQVYTTLGRVADAQAVSSCAGM